MVTLGVLIMLAAGGTMAADADDVVAAETAWARAVTAQNFDTLDRILSDELIYAHSTGVIETKSEYLGKLKSGVQRYDVIDHETTTVRVHGNAAAAHSIVIMKGATKGNPFDNKLMMMHLWVKNGDVWQLAAHQTTRLEQ